MQDIFRTLPAISGLLSQSHATVEAQVFAAWRRAAGSVLALRAAPIEIKGTTLRIAVENKNWQRQLTELAAELIYKINTEIGSGQITFLEFTIDEGLLTVQGKEIATETGQGPSIGQPNVEMLPAEVTQAAEMIKDSEMRRQFLRAAASCAERRSRQQR
jgi:hypothetical protein